MELSCFLFCLWALAHHFFLDLGEKDFSHLSEVFKGMKLKVKKASV